MSKPDISSVGDHFLIGLRPSVRLHERDRALLADLRPAGVILFKSNFQHDLPYEQWLETHLELIAAVREAVGRDRMIGGSAAPFQNLDRSFCFGGQLGQKFD